MIREMKHGEEDKVRVLIAKLSYADQTYWRRQTKAFEEYLKETRRMSISNEVNGKNVILVAEEQGMITGLCWCTIVDRGVDKQGEIAEFYVDKEFRGKDIGKRLIETAKQLFVDEKVEVAFVWTHHENQTAIKIYKDAGFKEVDQLVMAFIPSKAEPNRHKQDSEDPAKEMT